MSPALLPPAVFLALALLGFWLDPDPTSRLTGCVVFGLLALAYTGIAWHEAEERYRLRLCHCPKPEMLVSFWGVRCWFVLEGEGCSIWGTSWLMDKLIPWAGTLDLIACRLTGREAFAFLVLEVIEPAEETE